MEGWSKKEKTLMHIHNRVVIVVGRKGVGGGRRGGIRGINCNGKITI